MCGSSPQQDCACLRTCSLRHSCSHSRPEDADCSASKISILVCCCLLQDFLDKEVPKRIASAGCGGELLHSIVDQTDVSSLLALSTMDKLPHAVHGNGVAYVGDAWHPMSPFCEFTNLKMHVKEKTMQMQH